MMNKEAIELLCSFRICVAPTLSEAMSVAISALQAQELSNNSPELDNNFGDLIRRQEVIDAIEILMEQSEDDEHDKTWNNAIRGSTNAVKHHVPSAQPEVIRCNDCKHWIRESICDGFCSEDCMRHDEDFYCGYAERKEENR